MMRKAAILLCSAMLLSCSKPSGTLSNASPAPSPNASPFTLSIVATEEYDNQPDNNGDRFIYTGESRTFYVVLTNVSDKAVPIFEEWSSWGYYNISFEAVTADGKTFKLTKGSAAWGANAPAVFSIPPGGHYVFVEHFQKERWTNLPDVHSVHGKPVMLKAVFEETKEDSMGYNVWIGRVESKPEPFLIY
jgi:hypothetical protein